MVEFVFYCPKFRARQVPVNLETIQLHQALEQLLLGQAKCYPNSMAANNCFREHCYTFKMPVAIVQDLFPFSKLAFVIWLVQFVNFFKIIL